MTNSPAISLSLQALAAAMSQAFERAVRPASGESFCKLKDDAPAWMTAVCRQAHEDGQWLPDDWRYEFIEQAVDALADHADIEAARASLEADIYTSDLTAWLHSLNRRVYYLGEALSAYGAFTDGFHLLAAAQMIEKEEVFQQVVMALQDELECREDNEATPER